MSATANAGAISVNVIVLPDSTGKPDQILGFLDSAATTTTRIRKPPTQTQPELYPPG